MYGVALFTKISTAMKTCRLCGSQENAIYQLLTMKLDNTGAVKLLRWKPTCLQYWPSSWTILKGHYLGIKTLNFLNWISIGTLVRHVITSVTMFQVTFHSHRENIQIIELFASNIGTSSSLLLSDQVEMTRDNKIMYSKRKSAAVTGQKLVQSS